MSHLPALALAVGPAVRRPRVFPRAAFVSRQPRQRALFCVCGWDLPSRAGLCRSCYRVARLAAFRLWLPELLLVLWIEQHPDVPVQLQLPVAA